MSEIIISISKNSNKTIAIVEDGILREKYEETEEFNRLEGNIYIGKVVDVLPGLQAAFVDIGENLNAFLHIKDILPKVSNKTGNKNEQYLNYRINDYIKEGMPIVVQIKKDKTEKKGARVSTNINIGGRYVALVPNQDFITVSQKIEEKEEIFRLKKIAEEIDLNGNGLIFRTSSYLKPEKDLKNDIYNLFELNNNINEIVNKTLKSKENIPQLIYENGGIINKILIDLIDTNIERILINDAKEYDKIKLLIEQMQKNDIILELQNNKNLLELYNINNQIEKTKTRKIWLKSGACISIDKTEALTAIDVNTGKYTGKDDLEKTVYKVNEEATIEIANQLKLRDIGGIIIVDYIDMENKENENKILELLKNELKKDRAKTQVLGFSKLHLLEMTRKHIFSS